MKHINISTKPFQEVSFHCDVCGDKLPEKIVPKKCCICLKDICRDCKRHIHLESGTGNNKKTAVGCMSFTKDYCPTCFADKILPILSILKT